MSALRRALLGAALATAVAACTRAPYMVLFNAAGVPLTIRQTPPYDGDLTVAPGATLRARFPDAMRLEVTAGAATWRYAVRFPPRELARWSRLGRPEFQLQVEPDGRVYVLPPGTVHALDALPPQPAGFPLVPST